MALTDSSDLVVLQSSLSPYCLEFPSALHLRCSAWSRILVMHSSPSSAKERAASCVEEVILKKNDPTITTGTRAAALQLLQQPDTWSPAGCARARPMYFSQRHTKNWALGVWSLGGYLCV